jgi:hypothetical protein
MKPARLLAARPFLSLVGPPFRPIESHKTALLPLFHTLELV